ncbi:MAG: FAD-binding protein, partial [Acidaminobacteraceae bacterium]
MGRSEMKHELEVEIIETDVLIIGGGAAGCYASLELAKNKNIEVIIVDKANIERSGCLAAGINALNAYIGPNETADGYVDYVSREFNGVVREDLLKTIAEKLNEVTNRIEALGLPILKDDAGDYVMRGKRSVKINGEQIKPILARAVRDLESVQVMSYVNIFEYLLDQNRVIGAVGYDFKKNIFVFINSKVTICATGGAGGIYKA